MKMYEVSIAATMYATIRVEAEDALEAENIVEDNVMTIDYANETCGFDITDCYDGDIEILDTGATDEEIIDVMEV